MAIQRALLLIADIGGYTRFMNAHRVSLVHAQELVARLLEAVLDSARGFTLAKLEGDAAFFYASPQAVSSTLEGRIREMRAAFIGQREALARNRVCDCEGCVQVGALTLKFVLHEGEVAFQKVKRHTELAGVDVILVHRMLKNRVPVPEYVLMTEATRARFGPEVRPRLRELEHEFEGLGTTATAYLDLSSEPVEVTAPRSALRKVLQLLGLEMRGVPYRLGLKVPQPR